MRSALRAIRYLCPCVDDPCVDDTCGCNIGQTEHLDLIPIAAVSGGYSFL
jgi:hypothetical protein